MRYVNFIEDSRGDLVEIEVYCSALCWPDVLGPAYGHAWPCPEKADYRQYCPTCGTCTVAAIEDDSFDSWPLNAA
jgi:hypothetical protein